MFFFQWKKKRFFFQNLLFSVTFKVLKKCTYKFHSNCQNSSWILINCSPMFVTFDDTRKNGPIFCHRENATFWNVCFNPPLRFQRNGQVICIIFCQIILWTVINFSLAFAILDNTRKTRPKFSFRWKFCLFFSKLSVFNNLLWSQKSLYNFHGNRQKNSLWIHKNCSPMFVARDDTRKKGPKSFVIVKTATFEMFVPIHLLGPKQTFLSFAQ